MLGRDHTKIVPCLWIIRAQLQCLFHILTRLLKIISPQVERAEVVIGFRVFRFLSDDLLEGGGRRVEVAMLEERHSVGEVIALERIVIAHPAKRKRFSYAIGCGGWDRLDILHQSLRIDRPLIHLDDHAFSVEQEGGGNGEVPATVE